MTSDVGAETGGSRFPAQKVEIGITRSTFSGKYLEDVTYNLNDLYFLKEH
jgi:hypothetical protein